MRRIFKTIEDHLTECTTLEKGVWVHLQSPTKEEVDGLTTRFNLDPTFLPAALDEEESARIDYDSDKQQTLIIVDIPYVDTEGTGYVYSTIPLGIVLCDEVIITVCTRDTPIINDFTECVFFVWGLREIEVTTVMTESIVVCVNVLPRPILRG